jgi:hypothetical protein
MNPASNNQSVVTTIPEPFTLRDVLVFTIPGLILFSAMFAFMFSLSKM